ncbi:hypothetical protein BVG79_00655 [Ketogulonicigenium robustum]|uniref:Uncharacterized protein n=1 Tax=Ketogulonicigenium robustum TaxID=92947 RepID=A0A1W6NYA2_9RHOB|nr:hypothetical protein BVG79_00655 [Ketogulonicigenium robustum]
MPFFVAKKEQISGAKCISNPKFLFETGNFRAEYSVLRFFKGQSRSQIQPFFVNSADLEHFFWWLQVRFTQRRQDAVLHQNDHPAVIL